MHMYVCTYVRTTLPSTVCATRQTRCTLVQHIYTCMYEFHVVGWLSSNQLYSTCTLHNNRDQHAPHTTTEINTHPTQQQEINMHPTQQEINCTPHNNRDQHAPHTTTGINMHPTQQQRSTRTPHNNRGSTCTPHNKRSTAPHTTTGINMHPTQQQGSSACTTCDVHTIECSFTQSQSPSTITYGSTRFVESEGVGSRGYRTATQKTHHTLGVSYSEKILWE